jgi:hypothetical protein
MRERGLIHLVQQFPDFIRTHRRAHDHADFQTDAHQQYPELLHQRHAALRAGAGPRIHN